MKTKDFALHIKDVSEDGTFEGYGSVFGNADSYGEVVMPGAFAKSLAKHAKEKTSPLMLWQHNWENPIGVWDHLEEDRKGLFGKGRLLLGVQKADEAYILAKNGAVRGLSIGYREVRTEPDGKNVNLLELDLMEISPVSFPANRRATITAVKSDRLDEFVRRVRDGDDLPDLKEFEDVLGDLGFSKSQRVRIASHGYRQLRSDSGDEAKSTAISDLRAAVLAFNPRT